jgi:hypothetical protein
MLEIVFNHGVPANCRLDITALSGTQQRSLVSNQDGGLAFVPLGVAQELLQKTLDGNKPVVIALNSPARRIEWAVEPLLVFNARTPGMPMASAKIGDSQSTGTLQADGASALANLSYAGVANNYVQFTLNLPLPSDALAVGGFFRRDAANVVKPIFSFRVTDSRGTTYGYFTPEHQSDRMQISFQPLAHSHYHYGGPNDNLPPQHPLVLNALLFDTADHKKAGPAQLQISNLFALRQTRFDIAPMAPLPQPSLVPVDFAKPVAARSMSGFLHGSSDTQPPDERLLPVRPALWRIGFGWMENRDRLARLGIPTILILGDSWRSQVPHGDPA